MPTGIFNTSAEKKGKLIMSGIKRKEAREIVVGLLFETEFKTEENSKEIFAISTENRDIPEDEYVREAYFGVCENKEQIDTLITEIDLATEEKEIRRAKESDDMPWIDPAFRTMADFDRMRV